MLYQDLSINHIRLQLMKHLLNDQYIHQINKYQMNQ